MEQVFGTRDVPFAERGMLVVHLPEAVADAFDMVINYIYTDRIHCKGVREEVFGDCQLRGTLCFLPPQ